MNISDNKIKLWKRFYWVPLFLVFCTTRFFSGNAYILITGDACKYLTLGRNFPYHTLYNHQLYLIHSPVFGWCIGIMNRIMPLCAAGLAVSLMFAVLSFWGTKRLCASYGLSRLGTSISLLYISLSGVYITFDAHVSRVTILTFFVIMSLLNFHEYLKHAKREMLYLTIICVATTLFISEQGILLLPALAVQYFFAKHKKRIHKGISALIIVIIVSFSIWPLVRFAVFANNPVYPAGIDGTIEYIANNNYLALLNPNFLPNTSFHNSNFGNFSFSLQYFDILSFARYVSQIPIISIHITFSIAILLILLVFFKILYKRNLKLLELILISFSLFFPCFFNMHQWYGISAIIPFSLVLGVLAVFKSKIRKYGFMIIFTLSFVFICKWFFFPTHIEGISFLRVEPGSNFMFSRKVVTPGYKIRQHLKLQKNDGLMAPIDLVPGIVYLTRARCLALPMQPQILDSLITSYNIKYIVFSDEQLLLSKNPKDNLARSAIVCNLIYNNHEKYKKILTWQEKYPETPHVYTYYVFKPINKLDVNPETMK